MHSAGHRRGAQPAALAEGPAPLPAYAAAALRRACDAVATVGPGGRNHTVNGEAYGIGRLVGAGALRHDEAEAALLAAVAPICDRTFTVGEAGYTIRRALTAGAANPADLSHVAGRSTLAPAPRRRAAVRAVPMPAPAQAQARPPADEVARLWHDAVPVTDDDEAAAWLRSRGLDPAAVADRELARAIRPDAACPRWAAFRRSAWTRTGHRLICPAWDASGRMTSVHARCVAIGAAPHDAPKGLWPAAGPGSAAGLVMADALGRVLLASGSPPWFDPEGAAREHGAALCIAEGLPDFLTLATDVGDAGAELAPAVWGFVAGGPSPDVAARIPGGWTVAVAADEDAAGDRYLVQWNRLIGRRCCFMRMLAGAET